MRGKRAKKNEVQADYKYNSRLVTRLIHSIMLHGKKSTAESIVYTALEELSDDKKEALSKFEQAMNNIMPKQEVRSRRVGGATYQVPMPVKHDRSQALAMRWLVNACRNKKGMPMNKRLSTELIAALDNQGAAVKKKEEVHKMADSNKAFAHFRF